MKNQVTTAVLWVTGILATAYLSKGQDSGSIQIIILVILAAVNIYIIKKGRK